MKHSVRDALDLLHMPVRVHALRTDPLPDDVGTLLEVVSGNHAMTERIAAEAERPVAVIQEASAFYVEQILLAPDADSYRILAGSPGDDPRELRRNMALLMRWLHPDHDPEGERSVFAARVLDAWHQLRSGEHVAHTANQASPQTAAHRPGGARDAATRQSTATPPLSGAKQRRTTARRQPPETSRDYYYLHRPGPLRRFLLALIGARRA